MHRPASGVGVELLRRAGVRDSAWLEIVAAHHDDPLPGARLDSLSHTQRMVRLLRQVDVFTAKISRRRARAALPPTVAVRADPRCQVRVIFVSCPATPPRPRSTSDAEPDSLIGENWDVAGVATERLLKGRGGPVKPADDAR